VHVQRLRGRPPRRVPHLTHELVTRDDPPGIPDENPQQVELLGGELELLVAHPGPVRLDVDAHAVRGRRLLGLGRAAPQQGPDAGQQLGEAERLGDVVVGAGVQAHDRVHLVGARGQDEDRHGVPLGAQPPGHLQAVHAGQPEVEHTQIDAALDAGIQRGGAVLAYLNLVPLPAQGAGQGFRDGRVVLGEQYSGHELMVVRCGPVQTG
jgi:hypothetical protein